LSPEWKWLLPVNQLLTLVTRAVDVQHVTSLKLTCELWLTRVLMYFWWIIVMTVVAACCWWSVCMAVLQL